MTVLSAHDLLDGRDDVGVGAATAEIAAHQLADLVGWLALPSPDQPTAEQIWPGVQ